MDVSRLTLTDFAGDWQLERLIDDRLSGQCGSFSGIARFTAAAGGFDYLEEGVLRLPGQVPLQAVRRYLWRGAGQGIDVFFADNRPFHRIDLGGPVAEDSHWCDPDSYDVRYDFTGWPDWQAEWQVSGPRKDYTMTSLYCRGENRNK